MFTPLPPARSGTADYAAQLVQALRTQTNLEVFDSIPRGFNAKRFDAVIYQIANNPWHADIYRLSLDQPGIIALHDANLHDLVRGLTLGSGSERAYIAEVTYEIFGTDRMSGEKQERVVDVPQPRTFTMLRRLLNASQACIVHSKYAERAVRLKDFRKPVAVIPHGARIQDLQTDECRRDLQIENFHPIIGLFGYQRPDKRPVPCLRAFAKIAGIHPGALLLVAGAGHPDVRLQPLIEELNLEGRVAVRGFQETIDSFDTCIAACDVVLNLKYPTFGETSGTMMHAFGLSRTVIVSDEGACRELPDEVCLKVSADVHEETVLTGCLEWLLEDPSRTRAIGGSAREWATKCCSWDKVATMYLDFAESISATNSSGRTIAHDEQRSSVLDRTTIVSHLARWNAAEGLKRSYFDSHEERLIRTVQLVPPAGPGECILEIGSYGQITPLLNTILGYANTSGCYLGTEGVRQCASVRSVTGEVFEWPIDLFNAERDAFPYPEGTFATVICGEVLEHLEVDPVHMINEIHRVLVADGILVLTTPNIVSTAALDRALKGIHPASFHRYSRDFDSVAREPGHSREYTPDEIRLLLSECGFAIVGIETGPYYRTAESYPRAERVQRPAGFPPELRGDCIFAVARKESFSKKRFPAWLYGE